MKKFLLLALLPGAVIFAAFPGCQPSTPPAKFEISSMQIKPNQVFIGETSTVTAVVTNTGGSSGIHNIVLRVDTVRTAEKSVQLAPGASQTVTFTLTRDSAGTYQIEVGGTGGKLTVKPRLIAKESEIIYDDGFPQDYLLLEKPATGYLVLFTPESEKFVINNISIMGILYGSKGVQINDIEVQVWDKNMKAIHTTSLDCKKFPQLSFLLSLDLKNKGDWVDIQLPDIEVQGNFYVHIHTGPPTGFGFRMGVDDSTANTHSDVTIRGENGVDTIAVTWPFPSFKWFGDKTRVNWMVRAGGNALVPEK